MDHALTVQVDINGATIHAFLMSFVMLDSSSSLELASMYLLNAQHLTMSMELAFHVLLVTLFNLAYVSLPKIF